MDVKTKFQIGGVVVLMVTIGVLAYLYYAKTCPPMITCPECKTSTVDPLAFIKTRSTVSNFDLSVNKSLTDPGVWVFTLEEGPNAKVVATEYSSGTQKVTKFPYLIKSIAVIASGLGSQLLTISETGDLRSYFYDSDMKYTLNGKVTTGCSIVCPTKDALYILKPSGVFAFARTGDMHSLSVPAVPSVIINMCVTGTENVLWITDGTKYWYLDTSKNEWTEFLFTASLLGTDMSLM